MKMLSLESFDFNSISEHICLGALVYSSPEVLCPDHISWKHLNNPFGSSVGVCLRNEFKVLVGRSFIHPHRFWVEPTKPLDGATITDLVIAPGERNASTLVGMTRAIISPAGFDLTIHTSNENSDPIYHKLFKFPIAFTLKATGLPIRISNVIKPYLKNSTLRSGIELLIAPWRLFLRAVALVMCFLVRIKFSTPPVDSVKSEIFNEFRQHVGPHFERSQSFLKWRFADGPIFDGQVEWVWVKGECLGYVVFKQVSLGGLIVLVILDTVFRRRLKPMEGIAIKLMAARLAIHKSCDAIFSLVNLENSALKWLMGFPFFKIADHHLPHATPIYVHVKEEFEYLRSKNDIFFTLADLDYF